MIYVEVDTLISPNHEIKPVIKFLGPDQIVLNLEHWVVTEPRPL